MIFCEKLRFTCKTQNNCINVDLLHAAGKNQTFPRMFTWQPSMFVGTLDHLPWGVS